MGHVVRIFLSGPVHALRGITGNQGKFTKKQSRKTNVFLYFPVLISHLVTKHTAGGETPILGLPAFLSRSSECCGRTNIFYSENRMIWSSLSSLLAEVSHDEAKWSERRDSSRFILPPRERPLLVGKSLSRSSHKNNVSVTLVSRLMNSSIDSAPWWC